MNLQAVIRAGLRMGIWPGIRSAMSAAGWAAPAVLLVLLGLRVPAHATSCTTQAELSPQDRNSLTAAAGRLAMAVTQQDLATLQAALLPAEASEWEGIHGVVETGAALVKGGQVQVRGVYLLDASTLVGAADVQFFCSNTSGSLTVTITMRGLPPGRYAVVLADAAGAPLGGQMGIILVWDSASAPAAWRLGGLTLRQGILDGHDGVWWWARAREVAKANLPWSAYYCYEAARALLVPVDFLSSPNLEKLGAEQAMIKGSPQDAFPYTLVDGPRTWKIDAVRLDTTLRQGDLAVTYESMGITDPAALRTEATAVLSALVKTHPGMRENFHGLWAYAVKDGKPSPVMELPMAQIP